MNKIFAVLAALMLAGLVSAGCENTCNGADIYPDCEVNGIDYAIMVEHWGEMCDNVTWCDGADINRNGYVGASDFLIISQEWGRTDCCVCDPPVNAPEFASLGVLLAVLLTAPAFAYLIVKRRE